LASFINVTFILTDLVQQRSAATDKWINGYD